MCKLRIKPFETSAETYEQLSDILTAVYPDHPISGTELARRDSEFHNANCVLKRYFAHDGRDEVIGSGVGYQMITSFHPQRFVVKIEVLEEHRRQGVGGQLYEKLISDLAAHDVREIHTRTPDSYDETARFLENRGFTESKRDWISTLDVMKFDAAPFQSYLAKTETAGISITSLAEEKEINPNYKNEMFDLHSILRGDAPQPYPFTPHPFEVFVQRLIDNPDVLPEGYFIAKDGDRYIGESFIGKSDSEPGVIIQGLTGVLPEYRGRGIAVALKLHVIELVRKLGYQTIKTDNDTLNAPMLAINTKLGFQRGHGWIHFEKWIPEC